MLVYGNDKFQKYYFINKYLKYVYNDDILLNVNTYKINNTKSFKFKSNKNYYELDINKKKFLLIHNIIDFIKYFTNRCSFNNNLTYMVLLNADILPQHIQWSLRSIIEKTHTTTRYILTCSGLNKIEKPMMRLGLFFSQILLKRLNSRFSRLPDLNAKNTSLQYLVRINYTIIEIRMLSIISKKHRTN